MCRGSAPIPPCARNGGTTHGGQIERGGKDRCERASGRTTAAEEGTTKRRRRRRQHVGTGAEAILVSHQLPIWVTRLATEGRPLMHDPRQRECTLTSVTSLVFEEGRERPRVEYHEPNAHLLAQAANLPGA